MSADRSQRTLSSAILSAECQKRTDCTSAARRAARSLILFLRIKAPVRCCRERHKWASQGDVMMVDDFIS